MRKVYLYGDIARKYGDVFDLEIATAGEAITALVANFPKIEMDIREDSWTLFRGDPETGMCLDEEAIAGMHLGNADLHIMPEVIGSKKGNGILKAVVGVALIAVSFGSAAFLAAPISTTLTGALTWGNAIGQLGLALALSGVSSMLTPSQESSEATDNDSSFVFSGPTNQTQQGSAVPLVYGEVITGGVLISGGLDTVDMLRAQDRPPSGDGTWLPYPNYFVSAYDENNPVEEIPDEQNETGGGGGGGGQ